MQTTLNLPPAEDPPPAIEAPFQAGRWRCAREWFDCYRMLCWGRRHTLYDTHRKRRDAYDEAIRCHVRALGSPEGRRLLRRDTDRAEIAHLRCLLDHTPLMLELLPLEVRLPLILLLHARENALS